VSAGDFAEQAQPAERAQPRRERLVSYAELLTRYGNERSRPGAQPIRLGWGSVDTALRGISRGQVCGVAARTGVGKTWALVSIAESVTADDRVGVLTLTLEQPGPEYAERALAVHLGVSPETVEGWARDGGATQVLREASGFLERHRNELVVEDAARLDEIPTLIKEAHDRLRVPVGLLLIDYLGLLGVDGTSAYERASSLGKGLKDLAKSENVAVVVAAQLSRAAGDGSEPVTIAMLRDSGVLEESVDFLLGLWRPEKSPSLTRDERAECRDVVRVAVLKNRKGPDGQVVELRFGQDGRRLVEPAEPLER